MLVYQMISNSVETVTKQKRFSCQGLASGNPRRIPVQTSNNLNFTPSTNLTPHLLLSPQRSSNLNATSPRPLRRPQALSNHPIAPPLLLSSSAQRPSHIPVLTANIAAPHPSSVLRPSRLLNRHGTSGPAFRSLRSAVRMAVQCPAGGKV